MVKKTETNGNDTKLSAKTKKSRGILLHAMNEAKEQGMKSAKVFDTLAGVKAVKGKIDDVDPADTVTLEVAKTVAKVKSAPKSITDWANTVIELNKESKTPAPKKEKAEETPVEENKPATTTGAASGSTSRESKPDRSRKAPETR